MSHDILVATDGSPASIGALRLAARLEARDGCRITVLGTVEPVPVFDTGFLVALPEMELYESRRDALRTEIEGQVETVQGSRTAWRIEVETGVPAPRIVRRAETIDARMILLGLGRHGPMERMFGTETALQVIRVSHIPVLAVPPETEILPRRAVLGVDFSEFSVRAIGSALQLLGEPWEAHFAFVMSGIELLPATIEEWRTDYEADLASRMDGILKGFPTPPGCATHFHVLEGEPGHELLDLARSQDVDLLVSGSHGHSFVGRLLMGSVSTRLIRGATIPVLVTPPSTPHDAPGEATAEESLTREAHPWVKEMVRFTERNAGRRTTLELDDPELGAQCSGKNFPLWGVVYDPRRNRLQIMLGQSGTVEGHLTHSIPGPEEVEVVTDDEGRDQALRIRLGRAQMILKIHRD